MLIRPAANAVFPGRGETVERSVDVRAFGFHRVPVDHTDLVQKEVERRPALQRQTIRQNPIPRDLLQQVQESQHFLQRAGLLTGLVRETR